MNEQSLEKIDEKLSKIQQLQDEIDRRTKDAEYYKLMNEKLHNQIKCLVIGMCICFCFAAFMGFLAYDRTVSKLMSGTVTTETVTETEEMSTGVGGVLINGDNNTSTMTNGETDWLTQAPKSEK